MTALAALSRRAVETAAPLPFEALWDAPLRSFQANLRGVGMPAELERRYGGPLLVPLRPDRPTLIANFVSTLDGVVAFGGGDLSGGGLISGHFEPDRFVMGLLRALADAVVVGAGTLRASSHQRWVAPHVHPASAGAFAAWRVAMGLPPWPTTIVVSASGSIPLDHPGLRDPLVPVVIATTASGAARLTLELAARSGPRLEVAAISDGSSFRSGEILRLARQLGAGLVLTEGGPHLLGRMVADGAVDELFLTLSPQLVGRGDPRRLGLVEGLALPPAQGRWGSIESVRRAGEHLFLRYAFSNDAPRSTAARSRKEH